MYIHIKIAAVKCSRRSRLLFSQCPVQGAQCPVLTLDSVRAQCQWLRVADGFVDVV